MRWACLILAGAVVAISTFAFSQSAVVPTKSLNSNDGLYLGPQAEFSSEAVGDTSLPAVVDIHPVELQGSGMSQVPEPSSMAAFGLLATAFLVRRRRVLQ